MIENKEKNMNLKVVKHYTIYLSIGLIIALAFLKVRALFFLPELELPVIVYEQIVEIPNSSNEISRNIFHSQISDLSINGYQTITPRDLRAYKAWGKTLPENPIIIAIESIDKSTINYAASILTNYNFSATICIPEEQLKEINNKSVPELATKEELVAFREADVYSYGLKLSSSQYKLASEIKSEINLMKQKLNFAPEAITFPNENNAEAQKALCSTAGVKIGFSPKADTINKLNTKTDFRLLKQQKAIGNRLTFSINAIRHPGALSAGEIFISQPVGQRFKACVSVFDKNFELLLGQQYDALPEEPVLLGKLPNKVEYPISVYITDATGILVYRHEQFNRYTIERGEPVPLEEEIPEALKKALDEIEIPVETGEL